MKEGFYLSPDGLHIIEIGKDKWWQCDMLVIGMSGEFLDCIAEIDNEDLSLIFSSWEYLE